jgi:hypothetical protein
MTIRITMMGHADAARRREGRGVAALEQVLLVFEPEGLGHRVGCRSSRRLDQVISLRDCSIDSSCLPEAKSRLSVFWPRCDLPVELAGDIGGLGLVGVLLLRRCVPR